MSDRITVSYSEIAKYRQCPLAHQLAYRERWQSPERGGARGLGTLYHSAMEAYLQVLMEIQSALRDSGDAPERGSIWSYGDGSDASWNWVVELVWERVWTAISDSEGSQNEDQSHVEFMFRQYLLCYNLNPHWTIRAIEQGPTVPLYNPDGSLSRFDIKTKLDAMVEDSRTGRVSIIDWKSSGRRFDARLMWADEQQSLYQLVLGRAGHQVDDSKIGWAYTQTHKNPLRPEDYHRLMTTTRNLHEMEQVQRDAILTLEAAYAEPRWPGDAGSAPDPTTCRFCDFEAAHSIDRKGLAPIRAILKDNGFVQNWTRH